MSRAVAVIQARMGSSRLPGKVLADLGGAPLLARMIERVRAARRLADVVLAVPEGAADAALGALAARLGVTCVTGPEDDVLARFVRAAARSAADPIVRLTADCPLVDPELVDWCVGTYLATPECDYLAFEDGYPDGLDVEVVSGSALRRADAEARLPSEREHVTPYVWKHPDRFRCVRLAFPAAVGPQRWTVDEPCDLELVRAIWARLGRAGRIFGWRDVVALLASEPALARLNADVERNAGYRRSLEREAGGGAG
ncbi:MAG: glycosyltransferase family protein [Candidatus Binatia bacterium]